MTQAWVDAMSAVWQSERSATQMTLGQLIEALSEFDPNRLIVGFGKARSYRGYYSDLAFEPVESTGSVGSLLHYTRNYVGQTFEGYKGGDYVMDEGTPLWFSEWGEASGLRELGNLFGAIREQEVKHDGQRLYAAIPLQLVDSMAGLEKQVEAYFAGAEA